MSTGREVPGFPMLLVSVALVMVVVGACSRSVTVTTSGRIETRDVPVTSFTRLEVADGFEVNVSLGERESLTLRVDHNVLERLDVGVSEGTLRISLEPNTSVSDAQLEADVTVRSLSAIDISRAATVHVAGELAGERLEISASGAGTLDATVRVDDASVRLSGASNVTLTGSAARLVAEASGASDLDAEQLESTEVTVEVSGASTATVTATDSLSARASGGSSIRYGGSPEAVEQDASGGSTVTPLSQ